MHPQTNTLQYVFYLTFIYPGKVKLNFSLQIPAFSSHLHTSPSDHNPLYSEMPCSETLQQVWANLPVTSPPLHPQSTRDIYRTRTAVTHNNTRKKKQQAMKHAQPGTLARMYTNMSLIILCGQDDFISS